MGIANLYAEVTLLLDGILLTSTSTSLIPEPPE
jgi:hypothetical protein